MAKRRKTLFDSRQERNLPGVVGLLRSVADQLEQGYLGVPGGEERIEIPVSSWMAVKLAAERKGKPDGVQYMCRLRQGYRI